MKKDKQLLDERQEREMLSVYKLGFWILFWGMFIHIIIATILQFEWRVSLLISAAVLLAATVVTTIDCARRGIWSEYFVPNTRNNLLASIAAAVLIFPVNAGMVHYVMKYGIDGIALANYRMGGISAAIAFALTFALLSVLMRVTEKRATKLEAEYEE